MATAAAVALLRGVRQQAARFAADGLPLAGVVGASSARLRSVLDLEAALEAGIAGGDGQDGELSEFKLLLLGAATRCCLM